MLDNLHGLINYLLGHCNRPLYTGPGLLVKQTSASVRTLVCATQKCHPCSTFCVHPYYFTPLKGKQCFTGPKF